MTSAPSAVPAPIPPVLITQIRVGFYACGAGATTQPGTALLPAALVKKTTIYFGQAGTLPTHNREIPLSNVADYERPLINSGDRSRNVVAAMLRAAFPGLSIEQRAIKASRLLGCSQQTARRLATGRTKPNAEHFLRLMKKIGIAATIEIIESEGR